MPENPDPDPCRITDGTPAQPATYPGAVVASIIIFCFMVGRELERLLMEIVPETLKLIVCGPAERLACVIQ